MKTNSETGHAINVANFSQLLASCSSFGSSYNPGNPALLISTLSERLEQANTCIGSIHAAQATLSNATAARDVAFVPFSKLVTRIVNAVKASTSSPQTDEQVRSISQKLQGRRAVPKKSEEEKQATLAEGTVVKEISASQMSFDSRIENFDKLIKLLASITEYTPNEEELKVTTLTTYLADLKAKNTAVINAGIGLSNLRNTRDNMLYNDTTGLVDLALSAKLYIKSVFGATSPQYQQVSSLKFTRPR